MAYSKYNLIDGKKKIDTQQTTTLASQQEINREDQGAFGSLTSQHTLRSAPLSTEETAQLLVSMSNQTLQQSYNYTPMNFSAMDTSPSIDLVGYYTKLTNASLMLNNSISLFNTPFSFVRHRVSESSQTNRSPIVASIDNSVTVGKKRKNSEDSEVINKKPKLQHTTAVQSPRSKLTLSKFCNGNLENIEASVYKDNCLTLVLNDRGYLRPYSRFLIRHYEQIKHLLDIIPHDAKSPNRVSIPLYFKPDCGFSSTEEALRAIKDALRKQVPINQIKPRTISPHLSYSLFTSAGTNNSQENNDFLHQSEEEINQGTVTQSAADLAH